MAEESRPWPGNRYLGAPGDAGPYSDNQWDDIWEVLYGSGGPALGPYLNRGVIRNWANELEVTVLGIEAVSVDTGAALVCGKFYKHTLPVIDFDVDRASAGNWREDLICLQSNWLGLTAQTIRIAHIEGVELAGPPALAQDEGDTYEIPLAMTHIDDAGNITLTDLREYVSDLMQPKQLQVQAAPNTAFPGATWSEHQCRAVAKLTGINETCSFSFVVPTDFISLLSATIYVWTNAGGTFNWDLLMMAAHCGQLTNAVTDNKAAADKVSTAVTMYCLDAITALGGIVAGHHVGLTFKLNAIGACAAVNVATLLLEYR